MTSVNLFRSSKMDHEQIAKYYLQALRKGNERFKILYLENLNIENLERFLSIPKDDLIKLMKNLNYSSSLQEEILSAIETVRKGREAEQSQPNKPGEQKEEATFIQALEDEKSATSSDDRSEVEEPIVEPKDTKQPLYFYEKDGEKTQDHKVDYSNSPEWVQDKCQWYLAQNLTDFKLNLPSEQNPQVFEAEFSGATIHYATPNDVSVSKDAGFKVYDTILKEPQNKDREIEFPETASTHLSTMLFAASILNGNKMTGFDTNKFDINLLNKAVENGDMTSEQLEAVMKAYQEARTRPTDEKENTVPLDENPEDKKDDILETGTDPDYDEKTEELIREAKENIQKKSNQNKETADENKSQDVGSSNNKTSLSGQKGGRNGKTR